MKEVFVMKKIFVGSTGYIRAGWSVLLSVIVYMLSALIAFLIAKPIFGNATTENVSVNNIMLALQQIICAVLLALMFRKFYKKSLLKLLLDKKKMFLRFIIGVGIGSVAATLVNLIGEPKITWLGITPQNAMPLLTSFFLMLTVGFSEEFFARGYIMTAMRTTGSKLLVFLSSALIFSLIHITNPEYDVLSLVNAALLGLAFGYALVRTGSLWLPMGAHFAWNFVITGIFGTGVGHDLPNSLFYVEMIDRAPIVIGNAQFSVNDTLSLGAYILMFLLFRFAVPKEPDPVWTLDKLTKEN
jgi:membrane protease YdiL (CAAX protease family)